MMLKLRYLIPLLLLILIFLPGCSGPETVTETVAPARIARECSGPSPQIVAAWRADLMKSGISAIPMPKPVCVDVEIPEQTETRPATWGERLGWGLEPPPTASYLAPGCGLAATDQQPGVEFCARDNDRGEQERSESQADPGTGCAGDCSEDEGEATGPETDPDPEPAPTPPPGMMGPGAD